MPESGKCVFCDSSGFEDRIIRAGCLSMSFVSRPWFRPGHCLVIPNRHVSTPAELEGREGNVIMEELGRLSLLLDRGYGAGIMQKYQPLQAENEVKVNHLHFHVFPRLEHETGLFPMPEPNSFDGFSMPDESVAAALAKTLR